MKKIIKPLHNSYTNTQKDTRVRDVSLQFGESYDLLQNDVSAIKTYIKMKLKTKSSFYLRHEESKTPKSLQILWKDTDYNGFVKISVS